MRQDEASAKTDRKPGAVDPASAQWRERDALGRFGTGGGGKDKKAAARRAKIARDPGGYLTSHAGTLPKTARPSEAELAARARRWEGKVPGRDRKYNAAEKAALRLMEQLWDAVKGYFPPGTGMPVPRFRQGGETVGAVGFAPTEKGPQAVGVVFEHLLINDLLGWRDKGGGKITDPKRRDAVFQGALQTILHEWAHNMQKPELYAAETKNPRPTIEGGAEAFAVAVTPLAMKALGRKPTKPHVNDRKHVVDVAAKRGMDWILRGQFGR